MELDNVATQAVDFFVLKLAIVDSGAGAFLNTKGDAP